MSRSAKAISASLLGVLGSPPNAEKANAPVDACCRLPVDRGACRSAGLSHQADHHRRAGGGRRSDGYDLARHRAVHVEASRAADFDRERRRRRRHDRHRPRGARRARRLYAADLPRRTVDRGDALPAASVRHAAGLCRHRSHHRRADDDHRTQRFRAEQPAGLPHLRQGTERQDHDGQRRRRLGLASVRHAAHVRDQDRVHHRSLSRHGAGDERPDRQADRHELRSGDQHHGPDPRASR